MYTGDSAVELNATVNLEMIWVEPGTFTMGNPRVGGRYGTDEKEHNVSFTRGFYLGMHEVTQAQYQAVMTGVSGDLNATPSNWHGYPNRPVEKVSWEDAQIFLTRLNAQQSANIPAGWAYQLPTEAQWEYACRAGTTTDYWWGDEFGANQLIYVNANFGGGGLGQTCDVGQYLPNPWGFFDMHGNVWELCADWYADYPSGSVTDPIGPASGSFRVMRGGSYSSYGGAEQCRSAVRHFTDTGFSTYSNG